MAGFTLYYWECQGMSGNFRELQKCLDCQRNFQSVWNVMELLKCLQCQRMSGNFRKSGMAENFRSVCNVRERQKFLECQRISLLVKKMLLRTFWGAFSCNVMLT